MPDNWRKELEGKPIAIKDLRLGDVVQQCCTRYSYMTVVGVRPDRVKVHRPFTHISDFSVGWSGEYGKPEQNGAAVLYYTGVEIFEMHISSAPITLIEAGPTDIK